MADESNEMAETRAKTCSKWYARTLIGICRDIRVIRVFLVLMMPKRSRRIGEQRVGSNESLQAATNFLLSLRYTGAPVFLL